MTDKLFYITAPMLLREINEPMTLDQLLAIEAAREDRLPGQKSWTIYHIARLSEGDSPISPLKVVKKYMWGAGPKEVLGKVRSSFLPSFFFFFQFEMFSFQYTLANKTNLENQVITSTHTQTNTLTSKTLSKTLI